MSFLNFLPIGKTSNSVLFHVLSFLISLMSEMLVFGFLDFVAVILVFSPCVFQSQYRFVCEAILKVYEEGFVKPLTTSSNK